MKKVKLVPAELEKAKRAHAQTLAPAEKAIFEKTIEKAKSNETIVVAKDQAIDRAIFNAGISDIFVVPERIIKDAAYVSLLESERRDFCKGAFCIEPRGCKYLSEGTYIVSANDISELNFLIF